MFTRRDVIGQLGIGTFALTGTRFALAAAETDARLVIVVLRGAMDGLAMVPPYGDGHYRGLRGALALDAPGTAEGVAKLDGLFGLHPSMPNTFKLFNDRQALFVHAVASPYRERSHFDGQDVLENGGSKVRHVRDGWLNRALAPLKGQFGSETAIALTQNTPLILRGDNSVTTWAPSRLPDADEDTLRRLQRLYSGDEFFHARLQQALESQNIAGSMEDGAPKRRRGGAAAQFAATMNQAAKFLVAPDGPRIAVVESGGWDTHANQGARTGNLANRFAALDTGIEGLRETMGDHWADTAVAVVTEFGRTARTNGTRGTDHGTASATLLTGGAIAGGRGSHRLARPWRVRAV